MRILLSRVILSLLFMLNSWWLVLRQHSGSGSNTQRQCFGIFVLLNRRFSSAK